MFFLKWGSLALATALCVSCARNAHQPFDAEAHRAEWAARAPESPDLAEFARQFAEQSDRTPTFDPLDGFDLAEAEVAGLFFNGGLRTERARLRIAEVGADKAGLWPDPQVNLSVMKILDLAVEPWVLGADAALTMPLMGSTARAKALAEAHAESEAWRVTAEEWKFLQDLRVAWIEWSSFDQQAALTAEQIESVNKILEIVQTLSDADEIPRTESRLFAIERAALEIEHHHFTHESEERAMAIRTMIGFRPDAEITLAPAIQPFAIPPEDAHSHADDPAIIERHPTLQMLGAELAEAQTALERERRLAWGEMEIGPSYEQEEGVEKAGANAGLTLPLWNRNQRAIAEAEAELRVAEIARAAEVERLTGELAAAEHRLHAAQADWSLLSENLAPLVQEQVNEARAVAELGELDALMLLEALTKSYETQLRMVEVQAEIAIAVAELWNIAPPQPLPAQLKEMLNHDAE